MRFPSKGSLQHHGRAVLSLSGAGWGRRVQGLTSDRPSRKTPRSISAVDLFISKGG